MDLSNASRDASEAKKLRSQHARGSTKIDGAAENVGVQEEKAVKKYKRMIANRASAEKSRLKKRAELEELQREAKALSDEQQGIKDELLQVTEEHKKLSSENKLLKDKLAAQLYGPDFISKMLKGDAGAPLG